MTRQFLVYWKTYWNYGEEGAKEHVVTKGYGSGAVKFVADDRLWVVATDRAYQTEWKLLQFIRTTSAMGGRAFADPDYSRFFPHNQSGFESVLRKLQFRSGKAISRSGRQIGQQLQRPRPLSNDDITLLKKFAGSIDESKYDVSLHFPDQRHRSKVEEAAIKEAVEYLKFKGYEIMDKQNDNCGYDLLATRRRKPHELHVEVKGTSGSNPQFFISRNEKKHMLNSEWRIVIVTNALDSPVVSLLTKRQVESMFLISPFAWHAKLKNDN